MASMEALGSKQQAVESEIMGVSNVYNEEEILIQIDAIHVTGAEEFDAESLFVLVENIVKHAAPIVGSFVPVHCIPYRSFQFVCLYVYIYFGSKFGATVLHNLANSHSLRL